MVRYTTPTLYFELNTKLDLNDCDVIQVTLKNRLTKFVINEDRISISDKNKFYISLTQNETGEFINGYVSVQVRFKIGNKAYATDIVDVKMDSVLTEGEI